MTPCVANVAQRRFQGSEAALDAPVLPRVAHADALAANAGQAERALPQPAGEHAFVVGADRFGQAVLGDRQAQVTQQRPCALARQCPQAQQRARPLVQDAEDAARLRELRIGGEAQVQAPACADRHGRRWGAPHAATAGGDLSRMRSADLGHGALADGAPVDVNGVEGICDAPATAHEDGQAHDFARGPRGRRAPVAAGIAW